MNANLQHEPFPDEAPTGPINDGPALLKIKRLCHIARARLVQAPSLPVAVDVITDIERMATEAPPMIPDDTTPPSGPVTTPTLPEDAPETVIPAGSAEEVLSAALDDLAAVFLRVEALGMALARQLDATAKPRDVPTA